MGLPITRQHEPVYYSIMIIMYSATQVYLNVILQREAGRSLLVSIGSLDPKLATSSRNSVSRTCNNMI